LLRVDEPRFAPHLDRLLERVEDAAERAEQEQRHGDARHGEERPQRVPEQVHDHELEHHFSLAGPEARLKSIGQHALVQVVARGGALGGVRVVRDHDDGLLELAVEPLRSSSTSSADLRSRSPVGSSASSTWGSLTMARAMATRCSCPPES
jgi:hypothetical protein